MGKKKTTGKRTSLRRSYKSCRATRLRLNPVTAFIRTSLPAGLLFGLHAGTAMAGPEGGVVAAGEGSIAKPNTSTTVVNQASQNLIVNWESFNVN